MPKSGGIPQGTLFVAIKFTEVILVPTNPLLGGYNYRGTGDTGGLLEYIITYTPPPIAGDYRATVTVETPSQTELRVTKFSVLRELAAAALNTLYPISSGEALPGDLVILQLTLPNTDADDASSVTASGDLISGNLSMIAASKFHPALRAKWDVAPAANFLLPLKVPEDAVPGTFNHFVKVEDKAGQIVSLGSVGVAAKVKLVSARSTFNIYLLPRFNFITPALECFPFAAATVCTGSAGSVVEFDIEKLLLQTVPISKVDPAFLATIGHTPASGDVPLSRIVQLAFRFDATPGDFDVFDVETSTGIPPSFDSLKAGRGYILKTTGDGGIDPFARTSDASNSQFPGIGIPVPLKVTFTGKVIADPGGQLATFDVERRWNLVGPHSERDTSVGVFLNPVAIPDVVWEQLIAFNNLLDISLDENGNMKLLAGGAPEIVFLEEQFRTLLGPPFSDDPKGDSVTAGGGFWLFMCERPAPTCQGGELLPVLD